MVKIKGIKTEKEVKRIKKDNNSFLLDLIDSSPSRETPSFTYEFHNSSQEFLGFKDVELSLKCNSTKEIVEKNNFIPNKVSAIGKH